MKNKRNKCPVCGSKPYLDCWKMEFVVPDGWTLPTQNHICVCQRCGMIWHNNDRTQADYDTYYRTCYGYNNSLDIADSYKRQNEFCDYAAAVEPNKDALIVDFGGGDGYIAKRLNDMGYKRAILVEVGDELPKDIDLLISCHVFEHLYDLQSIFAKLLKAMADHGRFLIEVPDASNMPKAKHLPILDYHQKHINHFTPCSLDYLFLQVRYERVQSEQHQIEHHGVYIYRALYANKVSLYSFRDSIFHIDKQVVLLAEKLKKIQGPVIVWGLGDLCMHLLAKVKLDVLHYVDLDPHYHGVTIGGVPVLDHVEGDAPILVMAMGQKSSIMKSIRDAGLKNKVIEI